MFNKLFRSITFLRQNYARLILLAGLVLICLVSSLAICPTATALLRQHHETQNVLRYHAQDSLKDRDGNTWQVLLFPEHHQNATTTYFLRLVGFPGMNSFIHPQSLEILTSQGNIITASDSFAKFAPAANVGQYDLTPILSKLPEKGSLKLSVPLKTKQLSIKIPREVLAEWQLLTQSIENQ